MKHQPIITAEDMPHIADRHWHRLALRELRARRRYPAGTLDWMAHHRAARTFVRLAMGVPPNQWSRA